jgi:hypothetical protein
MPQNLQQTFQKTFRINRNQLLPDVYHCVAYVMPLLTFWGERILSFDPEPVLEFNWKVLLGNFAEKSWVNGDFVSKRSKN